MNCGWRHVQIVWPFYLFSFWTSLAVWFTGCVGFLRSCFVSNWFLCHIFSLSVSDSERSTFPDSSLVATGFSVAVSINPPRYASPSRAWELDAALDLEFLLILLSRFPVAVIIQGLLDEIRLFADGELVGTWEDKFIAVDFDFATLFSYLFLLLQPFRHRFGAAYQAGILSAASRAEWMILNKWRRLFHSSRVKFPLVKMSASWCLVSMYRIWILDSRLILSNNQSKATVSSWHLSQCGTSAFDSHLNHGFNILKDIQLSIGTSMCSAWWNVINFGQIQIGVERNHLSFCRTVWNRCVFLAHLTYWHERLTSENA